MKKILIITFTIFVLSSCSNALYKYYDYDNLLYAYGSRNISEKEMRKFVKKYWIGDAAIFYLIWYGVGRFFIEGLRTDPLMVGPIRAAQLTSVIMIVGGVVLFILRRLYKVYPVSYMDYVAEAE